MKRQDKLQLIVLSCFWASLSLFITFLTTASWLSFEGQNHNDKIMLLGVLSLLILLLVNLRTVFYYQTIEPSLQSPLFLALIVNITIVALGFMFVGQLLPFTLEDLILGILAIGRGEFNLKISRWATATGLVQWTCLLAGVGAMACFAIVVWHTWLQDRVAKYFTKMNRSST